MAKGGSGVVIPNFAKLVAAKPIPVAPIGAYDAAAISTGLGELGNIFTQNTQQQQQLTSIADALAPTDPQTAALIKAQASSINPFSTKPSNTIQQIEPLLQLAASKQYRDAEMGLQKQEFDERKLVDQANIGFKQAEERRIMQQLNAPPPSLGSVGSVTVSGGEQTPAYHESGVDNTATAAAPDGGTGILPALPGAPVTHAPQADPTVLMNQALDLYHKSYDALKQASGGRTPEEIQASDDPNDPHYADADQIVQMQGRIEQLYGSTDPSKANPQANPESNIAPKDPWSWNNIPEGGMATKVLAPDLAVRRRVSGGNFIEQDVEIKNGKQYVGPDRLIKPMDKMGQQSVTPVDLPDGSQVVHVVFPDGKTDNIKIEKPADASKPKVQQAVAPDGQVYNVVSLDKHVIIQASTTIKNEKVVIRDLTKTRSEISDINSKLASEPDEAEKSGLLEKKAAKLAYEAALTDNLRTLNPNSILLPDNAPPPPGGTVTPAAQQSLTDRLNALKSSLAK